MPLYDLCNQYQVTVRNVTYTQDAAGAGNPSYSDFLTSVPCRIEVASSSIIERFAREEMLITHELFTFQPGIRVGMIVYNPQSGMTYLIGGVVPEPATGGIPTYYHFVAEEQQSNTGL